MKLKPWYDVVKPREDLREGKPLDASEFAVNLELVRTKNRNLSKDYTDPGRFFERTFLTDTLLALSGEVLRRLSGITTEASAVFNTMTQFGGGKTHALTLLYHLATSGPKAEKFRGVSRILARAQVGSIPANTAIAVFIGEKFDALGGRGGADGTPLRKTPWGEIAYQLGASISEEMGRKNFALVAQHDAQFIEPKGDVIEKILPPDRPSLILMDEVLSFFSTYRQAGYGTRLYQFIQSLSETVRGRSNCVLLISAPKSDFDYSYTTDDVADLQRLENLLERLSKSVMLSAEADASEIIRRRLFEWDHRAIAADGRVMMPAEAHETCRAYGDWLQENRQYLPDLVNPDLAREQFLAAYPFHPMTISVFERKWQALPRFQRTRGILRLLALWVSHAYTSGYKGAHRDPLITLGSAPLEDPIFRPAVFEQLGQTLLETAVTTDIAGKKDAHAVLLDGEAVDAIKKARLHRKVATTIFFESNGGQVAKEAKEASLPEIRLALGEPEADIGNVETVLEALTESCYFLTVEKTRYHFSLRENLNKRFADRKATIQGAQSDELARAEIQKPFPQTAGLDRCIFPEKSIQMPDRPALALVVLAPDHSLQDEAATMQLIETLARDYGTSSRTFKSALIFCVAESHEALREEARKVLAWEAVDAECGDEEEKKKKLDDSQIRQLAENVKKARRDLREAVWRNYNTLIYLDKDNSMKKLGLGLVHSSAASDLPTYYLHCLRKEGDLEDGVSPGFLARNWPPALKEWPTKSVRDAFFASPRFPRLTSAESVKETIARGVNNNLLAYVGRTPSGDYNPFHFKPTLMPGEVEFSEDMFIITKDTAEAYQKAHEQPKAQAVRLSVAPPTVSLQPGAAHPFQAKGFDAQGNELPLSGVQWTGTGGKVGQDGVYDAGPAEGQFTVTAAASGLTATATVTVTKDAPPPPVPLPTVPKGFSWTGEVPYQKWMTFYRNVLARFASATGLTLTLTVRVAPPGGASQQQMEETQTALRDLGLPDDLKQLPSGPAGDQAPE
jgi:hypothetical protein